MENLFIYLVKSTTLLLLFYATYHFLLKKDTFFNTNRWFLLSGLFISVLLPLLTFKKTVWVEPVILGTQDINFDNNVAVQIIDLAINDNITISWESIIVIIYVIGVMVFITQLVVEFYSLRKIIKSKSKIKVDGFELIEVDEPISPFSFFRKIVYNPTLFEKHELNNIIEHEKIHAKQLHSLDVLFGRIYCILFWWNPIIWFYKKAMIQNLEFIADQNALAKAVNKKSYLLTLLKITTAKNPVAITNPFYQSLIKKRIIMLHTNQSKKHNSWKYLVVLPALVFFMLTYQVEVVAQEKQAKTDSAHQKLSLIEQEITAQTTNQELEEASMLFNQEFATRLEYSKLKRNKKGEIIAIKVALKERSSKSNINTVYEVLGNYPIKSFKVFIGVDPKGKVQFGYGEPKKYHMINLQSTNNESVSYGTAVEEVKNETENYSVEEFFETSSSKDVIELIRENTELNYNKAYISLNGKEINASEFEKINPLKVRTVVQLPPNKITNEVQKYGPKAVNGVIIIETSENEISSIDKIATENSNFNLDKENGGFTIHKRSQKSDFEFYENHLNKIGVKAKISGIERNSEGFITAIKIKLIDQERNHKMSENWTTSRNPNGIPDISIGRRKGQLLLLAK